MTLRLRERLAAAVRAMVASGGAPGMDAFVEEALIAALRERRHERLHAAYEGAAADPHFAADMASESRTFDVTLDDGRGH